MRLKFNIQLINLTLILVLCIMITGVKASDPELNVGDMAPVFNANDQDGELWNIADFKDKRYIVAYFYPAALTSGCTKQACSYRDNKSKLNEIDVEIIGISADPVKNLKIFGNIYNLNFTLLSDVNGEIAKMFGVPSDEGGSITREVDGVEIDLNRSHTVSRWTYIIDKSGKIVYKDTKVSAKEDSDKVIDFLVKQFEK